MTARETNLLNAFETTLTGTIGASDVVFNVNSVVDSAGNQIQPDSYLVLNPDSASNREVILISAVNASSKQLTINSVSDRYLTGSAANSGLSHASGSVVRMAPLQQHIEDINDRVDTIINEAGTAVVTTGVVKDEDNMASNSATHLATQQSIKAYVDTQLTAEDLDISADSGGNIAIDLDSAVLDLEGGTGIDTTTGTDKVTFAIDSTVATLAGSQTLTNKGINLANNTVTSTLAQLNTAVSDATLVDLDDTQVLTNKTINAENNSIIVGYVVTESGGNFLIDGEANATIKFNPGIIYRFDVSDSGIASHPFKLSTTSDGSHNSGSEYTTGKTTSGTQGSANAYIQYTVDADTPDNLYYYCSSHSGMGGKIGVFGSTLEGGNGLTITGNSIAVDATVITGQTNEGTADNNDVLLIYDDTASALKKQTRAAFLTGTGVGNMNSFTISDGSTSQTISDGNTVTFSGTSNEVEVAVSATDTVTIGLPSSITANLVGNVTGNVSGTAGGLSSTLTVASGGTGATSFADKAVIITQDSGTDTLAAAAMDANGELLIGGTSGPAVSTLTAGAGVTITNGDGTIEISAPDVGDITAVNTASNSGLAGGAATGAVSLTVDPSNLADGSSVTVDTANDLLILEDVTDGTVYKVKPNQIASGSANALVDGDSDFTITDGVANGIHYELDNTDMADWNQGGVALTAAGGIFRHNQTQSATYTIAATEGTVLAGPITITGTVTNAGTMVIL
jgi:hypothetical protein